MSDSAGDKTEAPTQKRRDDAAKRGDRPQSREIGPAFVMLGGAAYFTIAGAALVRACERVLGEGLALEPGSLEAFDPASATLRLLQAVAPPLGLLFAVTCVAAIVSGRFWAAAHPGSASSLPNRRAWTRSPGWRASSARTA